MDVLQCGGEVEVTGLSEFDLAKTLDCGQCFRWAADDNGAYTGVAFGRATRLRQEGGSVFIACSIEDFEKVWRGYFDLDRDYADILRHICKDDFVREAAAFSTGIRILRQDKWEALCSFIVSQCNNIPRIKKIITALCGLFGDRFEFEGDSYFAFPTANRLATLNEADLAEIRCGYRAAYIIGAARAVADGALDLESLERGPLGAARAELMRLRGVGGKVADCAALYGLHLLDAFPLDVWMKRAVAEFYGEGFDARLFSPFAGVAQQFIFHYIRSLSKG